MDTKTIIETLVDERDRLDHAIRLLRGDVRPVPPTYRRERTPEQRRAISDAMKKHWEEKRKKQREQTQQ
jgi:hypothetical protein